MYFPIIWFIFESVREYAPRKNTNKQKQKHISI